MFFSSRPDLLRALVVGPLGYRALPLFLRIAVRRGSALLDAFEPAVTAFTDIARDPGGSLPGA